MVTSAHHEETPPGAAKRADMLLNVRLPRPFKALLDARADVLGVTISYYIRHLIAADLGVDAPKIRKGLAAASKEVRRSVVQKSMQWRKTHKAKPRLRSRQRQPKDGRGTDR
jgi:hypothetical protein